MKYILIIVIAAFFIGCSNPTLEWSDSEYYSGRSLDSIIAGNTPVYGPPTSIDGPNMFAGYWSTTIIWSDGTTCVYWNDSGPDTPDWELAFNY